MARRTEGKPPAAVSIERLNIRHLRQAMRNNRFSFPSQVPVFQKHDRADLLPRIVLLYFLLRK
jgi:hypothetical protein